MVALKGTMDMKKYIVLPGLILACVFLTGCFGLVVAHPRQKCSQQFSLGNRGVVSNSPAATPIFEATVLELWGQPDSIQTNQADLTVWHYQGKRQWAVVIPAYIFLLPLPFPAGRNQVDIYFHDGIARKAGRSVMVTTGAFIGPPGIVFAWEKEEGDNPSGGGGILVGSGFVEEDIPVQAKP
jgi:hypothetical protein